MRDFFTFSSAFFNCVFTHYGPDSSEGVTLNLNLCLLFCLSLPLLASLCKCVFIVGGVFLNVFNNSSNA